MDGRQHGSRRGKDRYPTDLTPGRGTATISPASAKQQVSRRPSYHREPSDFLKPATRPFAWHQFIGLPHGLAADPLDGIAADCLLVAFRTLEAAGRSHPPVDPYWFQLAAEGRWTKLGELCRRVFIPIEKPEPFAIALIDNGPMGLGVGIHVDDGILITHHRRGVVWIPIRSFKPFDYFRAPA